MLTLLYTLGFLTLTIPIPYWAIFSFIIRVFLLKRLSTIALNIDDAALQATSATHMILLAMHPPDDIDQLFICRHPIFHVEKEYGMWVHVDVAYAGAVCVCPEFRRFLNVIAWGS